MIRLLLKLVETQTQCITIKAIIKEVEDHVQRKYWKLIPISEVSADTKILDSVWVMKRKRDIMTHKVYKYKARLNVHGGQ